LPLSATQRLEKDEGFISSRLAAGQVRAFLSHRILTARLRKRTYSRSHFIAVTSIDSKKFCFCAISRLITDKASLDQLLLFVRVADKHTSHLRKNCNRIESRKIQTG